MYKLLLLATLVLGLASCDGGNEYGECIGVDDYFKLKSVEKDRYNISTWNVVMGALFSEMLIPPIWVFFEGTFCPASAKPATP